MGQSQGVGRAGPFHFRNGLVSMSIVPCGWRMSCPIAAVAPTTVASPEVPESVAAPHPSCSWKSVHVPCPAEGWPPRMFDSTARRRFSNRNPEIVTRSTRNCPGARTKASTPRRGGTRSPRFPVFTRSSSRLRPGDGAAVSERPSLRSGAPWRSWAGCTSRCTGSRAGCQEDSLASPCRRSRSARK